MSGLCIPWDLNKMKCVFDTLSKSLLESSQFTKLADSPLATCPFKETLVSSTNMGYEIFDIQAISFIYSKNNNGPKIDPCATLHVTVLFVDSIPLNTTYSVWHDK